MKNIFSICFFILLSTFATAQSRLEKANELYELKSYWSAAKNYERLVDSDNDSPQMRIRLANSYYYSGNAQKAVNYYSKIELSEFKQEELYNYLQSTKMIGEQVKAAELESSYCSKFGDSKCKDLKVSTSHLSETHFTLSQSKLSTEYQDFGAYQFNDENIYILSDRGSGGAVIRKNLYNGGGFLDIYQTKKTGENQYSKVKRVKGKTNSALNEGSMCITSDNKRVYFTRNTVKNKDGIYQLGIFLADIDEKGKWINIKGLSINSATYSVGHPILSKDGKRMVFSSTKDGGYGGADLYIADVSVNGEVTNIKNLGGAINTSRNEFFPWLASDGNLYFTSDGHPGLGGLDNFVAIMAGENVVEIQNCGANINSPQDDFALTISSDGKNGFVSSNRVSNQGDDIYAVSLINPFPKMIQIEGTIAGAETSIKLANVSLSLVDQLTKKEYLTDTDHEGHYSIYVPANTEFQSKVEADDYISSSEKIIVSDKNFEKDFSLSPDRGVNLHVHLIEDDKSAVVSDAKITIKDKSGKKVLFTGTSNPDGTFIQEFENVRNGDHLDVIVRIEKPGYITKETSLNRVVDLGSDFVLTESMSKLSIGKDLAKVISINPIYFDVNSIKIRDDAKIELDKIVKVMNENPTMVIELGSHTDCRSSAKYNLTLSDKRAKASADYIRKSIVNPARITGKGYGESKLLNGCFCEGSVGAICAEEEHALNRRTEFKIVKF